MAGSAVPRLPAGRAMREESFEVALDGGVLRGHHGGDGEPALLLHGGPGFSDYLDGLAWQLADLFATFRYTQRGTPPSAPNPPYSIETHVSDALAVLDAHDVERAWVIGHSWGGHLALHLLVAHPERLLGAICIDPLGASGEVFAEFGENLRRGLSDQEVARLDEIEARRRHGEVTERELLERSAMIWPRYFADPASAPPHPLPHIGVRCSTETNASISDHFEQQTLRAGLPDARRPSLFVHGLDDPLPARASTETAALIPGATVELIAECGHFPWLEQPRQLQHRLELFLTA